MSFTISDPKSLSSAVLKKRSNDGSLQDDTDSLESAAQAMLMAIETKNSAELAKALRKAFEHLDKQPHEEGPHIEPTQETE